MGNGLMGDDWRRSAIRARVRLDFRTPFRKNRLFFGSPDLEKQAEEIRDQYVSLLRNVPIQGIQVEDIDLGADVYVLLDEETGREVAFAPVILTVGADSLEDLTRFSMREEFRKVEILEPDQLFLHPFEVERFIYRINEEQRRIQQQLERRMTAR
ncbi:hypothetical protein GJ688_00280 [Heliobacillus mobilis]|uniref:Uncharacterized protein n=1 Tax=Heliobacterium mobile TaxID=28064 RepID=A0A6I3SB12_HELMO|nr:hypothetical protein [Heliobacterium mobile]MTV47412.1 hypothetical protein [Heliobacterium mobile]